MIPDAWMTPLDTAAAAAQVMAALRAGRSAEAKALAQATVARGGEHPLVLHLAADQRSEDGDHAGALALLMRAVHLAPGHAELQLALGSAQLRLGQTEGAIAAFDAALRLRPGLAPALHNRGLAWERLGDTTTARRDWEAAAAADPQWPEPPMALAALEGRVGRPERARHWAALALQLDPTNLAAALSLAAADLADGEWGAAEARVQALLADPGLEEGRRALALSLHGGALAGLGRAAEAFVAYTAANDLWLARLRAQAKTGETALARVRRLHGHFAAAPPAAWRGPGGAKAAPLTRRHVFLMGFPRSGTTLVERVLAAHPQVCSLEERATLTSAAEDFMSDAPGLARLHSLSANQADILRRAYWRDVAAGLGGDPPQDKTFIDKLPLQVLRLPLIAALFPQAQVLFARRDPRDVVLSCFRQRFRLNRAMAEFLSLERTALYYDAVMQYAELCLPRCGLELHVVRYEDVVTAFRPTVTAALEALGLDWSPAVEAFAEAQKVAAINTPSAQQVARGLYTTGVGQWRAFAAELAPVLPILEPWVQRFGYAARPGRSN